MTLMTLLDQQRLWKSKTNEEARLRTMNDLRCALKRHLPAVSVWVYGSLVKPGRFHSESDVDLALETLPANVSLELLQSLLSREVKREVDVCELQKTRLAGFIQAGGQRWTP